MSTSITIPAQSVTIPAQVVSIPVAGIVYQNSWLAQTTGFSNSSLYTIPSEGLFRVSAAVFVVGISGNTSVNAVVSYPVPSTSSISWGHLTASALSSLPNIPDATSGACGSFVGISGLDVPLSVTVSGGTIDHYDLFVTIEQLQ